MRIPDPARRAEQAAALRLVQKYAGKGIYPCISAYVLIYSLASMGVLCLVGMAAAVFRHPGRGFGGVSLWLMGDLACQGMDWATHHPQIHCDGNKRIARRIG